MIKRYLLAYLGAGIVVAGLDAVWLTLTNGVIYRAALGDLLASSFRPVPAIAFYLLYLLGVVAFAVAPAVATNRWRDAVWRGALFGLVCYATYDLTNQATLVVWPTSLTLIDMSWGAVLTTAGASAGFFVARRVR